MQRGFVKLWRRSLDAGWLKNHKLWAFWTYCLLKASHKLRSNRVGLQEVKINPGQFIFGRKLAAKDLNIHESAIYRYIKVLEKMGNIETKSNNKFSIITIVNWDTYQGNEILIEHQTNNKRTSSEHKQECIKNEKNNKLYDFFVSEISPKRKSKQRALKNIGSNLKRFSFDDLKQSILNYKSTLDGVDPHYRKDPANFFGVNERYFLDFLPKNFAKGPAQQADKFKGDKFLKDANYYLTHPAANEDDFNRHCRGFERDPSEVRAELKRLKG